MPETQHDAILEKAGLPQLTPDTITTRTALGRTVGRSPGERLRDSLRGAPAYRFDDAEIERTAKNLKETGSRISHRIGWLG